MLPFPNGLRLGLRESGSLSGAALMLASIEIVLGIAGFFFGAKDPEKLGRWYKKNFGVGMAPSQYKQAPWRQNGGMTVLGPLPAGSEQFGSRSKSWIINFRVRNLDAMAAQLRKAGVTVEDGGDYSMGRFASLKDPEGNPIQLWELKGADLRKEELRPSKGRSTARSGRRSSR